MALELELTRTFVHLQDGGGAVPVDVTPSLWQGDGARYDRLLGIVDFETPEDLHASVCERHPHADEVICLLAGEIEVLLQEDGEERALVLGPGQAMIVPRGVWHRLVVRRAGRLLFVNSRAGMQTRRAGSPQDREAVRSRT
jgi:mannose-6-phosphate isomerase-like protein (cupin superfamily)